MYVKCELTTLAHFAPLVNIGIGIQHALKSAVVPWWVKKIQHSRDHQSSSIEEKDHHDHHNVEKDSEDADSMNEIVIESKDEVSSSNNRSLATESDMIVDTVVKS